jgi:hypothetical protein
MSNAIKFTVNEQSGQWISTVTNRVGQVTATITQADYDEAGLTIHPHYVSRSPPKHGHLRGLYQACCPRLMSNLLVGSERAIVAGDLEFRLTSNKLFFWLVDRTMTNAARHRAAKPFR